MSCLSAFSTEALSGEASFVLFCASSFPLVKLLDTKLFHRGTRLSASYICYASFGRSALWLCVICGLSIGAEATDLSAPQL